MVHRAACVAWPASRVAVGLGLGVQPRPAMNSSASGAKAGLRGTQGRSDVPHPAAPSAVGRAVGPHGCPRVSQPRATRGHGQHRARWAPPSPARGSAGDAPGRRSPPGPRDSLGKPSREGIPAPAWSQRWSGAPDTAPGCEQGLAMGTATPATATPAPHRQQRTPRHKHSPAAHTAPAPRTTRHCQPCLCNSACRSSPGPARPHGSPSHTCHTIPLSHLTHPPAPPAGSGTAGSTHRMQCHGVGVTGGHRRPLTIQGQVAATPAQLQVGELAEQSDAGDP